MSELPAKKALHEYRREPTEEELNLIARYVAEGRTKTYMAEQMGQTFDRISRLCKRVEVIQAAVRLRETEIIPQALMNLENKQSAVLDALLDLIKRVNVLERASAAHGKAMAMKAITMRKNKETIRTLRKERNELRSLIRRRGIVG